VWFDHKAKTELEHTSKHIWGGNNTDNYDFYSERGIYAKLTGLHGLYLTKSYDNKCVETERTLWRHENHLK
jgi:hypothetical protein